MENIARAIRAYEEALRIRTIEKYPVEYAVTQNNLGTAYCCLAEASDREGNLSRAILAYEEALKIYTADEHPLFHNLIKLNLQGAKLRIKT